MIKAITQRSDRNFVNKYTWILNQEPCLTLNLNLNLKLAFDTYLKFRPEMDHQVDLSKDWQSMS